MGDAKIERVVFDDPNAAFAGQSLEQRDGLALAPEIGSDRDRVFRRHQRFGDGFGTRGLDAAPAHRPVFRLGKAVGMRIVDHLRQGLARQHHVDGALRIALHEGMAAPQRLLGDDAGGQRIFPFHEGAHDARHVEGVLHEMHIGIA